MRGDAKRAAKLRLWGGGPAGNLRGADLDRTPQGQVTKLNMDIPFYKQRGSRMNATHGQATNKKSNEKDDLTIETLGFAYGGEDIKSRLLLKDRTTH